jgi:hypothetical protein
MNRVGAVPVIGAAVTVVLVVFASGYGYHRDELYFLWSRVWPELRQLG